MNDAELAAAILRTTDPDPHVRDWACFDLAEDREVDTPQLRDALAARLEDENEDVRSEALAGLAYRQDPRALPYLQVALSRPDGELDRLELVAAAAFGDPVLHDLVLRYQDGWDDDLGDLARRLTDPAGIGDDLIDGVADLYRRRAHGEPDGDALAVWQVLGRLLDIAPRHADAVFDQVLDRLADDPAAIQVLRTNSALAVLVDRLSG